MKKTYCLSIFGNLKKFLKFNQKEESTNYLPFSVSYYSPTVCTHSQEFTGLKWEITFLFLCNFFWIRNSNSVSGSRQNFRNHGDSDWIRNTASLNQQKCFCFAKILHLNLICVRVQELSSLDCRADEVGQLRWFAKYLDK